MRYAVVFEPLAQQDLQEAVRWYNNQQRGLGKRFYTAVQSAIKPLHNRPQMYAIRYKTVRTFPLPGFPYLVHYTENTETQTVIILAVLHTSRDPKIWDERSG